MQFAGQRTDMELNPIGDPYNILIKLTEDVLPDPDAILITGITPQATIADGISEAEFFKLFSNEIAEPGTIFVGFNNIRFDDEFIRFGLYRNFYDAYEWQWKDGSSKWDILDVVRITRALRPDGIAWPFASDGKPTNRLELLSALNKLDHNNAHDALSDVMATIDVAKLIRNKQPKLFEYMLSVRGKRDVEKLVDSGETFVYVSGMYSSEHEKLSVATVVGAHAKKQGVFVYDLRYDPDQYTSKSVAELTEFMRWKKDETADRLPVKVLQYNKCPAVAPISVLRPEDKERLAIDMNVIHAHAKKLKTATDFYKKILKASEILESERSQTALVANDQLVDGELYDGFIGDSDKKLFSQVHAANPEKLSEFTSQFSDSRLKALLPLYKARNFPRALNDEERKQWELFRNKRISATLPKFIERLQVLAQKPGLTTNQNYLLEELQLYAESIAPLEN